MNGAKIAYGFFGAIAVVLVVVLVDLSRVSGTTEIKLNELGYHVYRIGSIDANQDGMDDLWTVNHNTGGGVLLATGKIANPFTFGFRFPQDKRFPDFREVAEMPKMPKAGALIQWVDSDFVIISGQLSEPLIGRVVFHAKPVIKTSVNATAKKTGNATAKKKGKRNTVEFRIRSDGVLIIGHRPRAIAGWPIELEFESDTREVSIGKIGDHPKRKNISTRLRDYHSVATKDLNGDGIADYVIAGGGMRGRASRLASGAKETLLLSEGGLDFSFHDGPPKLGCPTRDAVWEDDMVRIACARGQDDNAWEYDSGEWSGGPLLGATELIPMHSSDWCWNLGVVRQMIWRYQNRLYHCAEGDFDGDGDTDTVVVRPIGRHSRESDATLYRSRL